MLLNISFGSYDDHNYFSFFFNWLTKHFTPYSLLGSCRVVFHVEGDFGFLVVVFWLLHPWGLRLAESLGSPYCNCLIVHTCASQVKIFYPGLFWFTFLCEFGVFCLFSIGLLLIWLHIALVYPFYFLLLKFFSCSLLFLVPISLSDFSSWWHHQMETFSTFWPFARGIHRWPVDSPRLNDSRPSSYLNHVG